MSIGSIPSKSTNIGMYSSGNRNYPDKVGRNAMWVQIPPFQQIYGVYGVSGSTNGCGSFRSDSNSDRHPKNKYTIMIKQQTNLNHSLIEMVQNKNKIIYVNSLFYIN